jgi:hypothetical protein
MLTFDKKLDEFDSLIAAERRRLESLTERMASDAKAMMGETAPVSDINEAGYVHFKDQFRVEKIAPFSWAIFNDKQVGAWWLWMLLEFGTRKMAPRKTVGPVMDQIGPRFLEEAGRFSSK